MSRKVRHAMPMGYTLSIYSTETFFSSTDGSFRSSELGDEGSSIASISWRFSAISSTVRKRKPPLADWEMIMPLRTWFSGLDTENEQ